MSSAPQPTSSRLGLFMFAAGFIVVFGLLIAYFSGMLEKQYNPNQQPVSFANASGIQVQLMQNKMGHYVTNGEINGQQVTFLLDTGATSVALNTELGERLGLIPGRRGYAQTANGTVSVRQTNISELKIGDITLNNVDATLISGMESDQILLGMSALKQLEWTQRGDMLTLKTL
ncbi:TIGR02281 family clan AA aspartic protease [Ningiella sp. W23]|uniref:retropepsin-like aspartic protease family protein n=1 Tax=Ningiella sp. W23 TaxID=3023715 RepID=UPI0037579F51